MVLVGYGIMVIGWRHGRELSGWFEIMITSINPQTGTCSIPILWVWGIRNQRMWVLLSQSMLQGSSAKAVLFLARLLCSWGSWCSLYLLNGWSTGGLLVQMVLITAGVDMIVFMAGTMDWDCGWDAMGGCYLWYIGKRITNYVCAIGCAARY